MKERIQRTEWEKSLTSKGVNGECYGECYPGVKVPT